MLRRQLKSQKYGSALCGGQQKHEKLCDQGAHLFTMEDQIEGAAVQAYVIEATGRCSVSDT
jgi:hypothetical protein